MTIASLRQARSGVRAIARALGRSPGTVSRELARNADGDRRLPEPAGTGAEPVSANPWYASALATWLLPVPGLPTINALAPSVMNFKVCNSKHAARGILGLKRQSKSANEAFSSSPERL